MSKHPIHAVYDRYGTDRPLVSISILSYNQREYLARVIDSVLAQRVDFPCEIIIGDDCSNDGSQQLLKDYARRFPSLIRLHLHAERYPDEVAGRTNNKTNLASCRGTYTAMLDGDDYWSCPDKLSRQVAVLEADRALSMSCHATLNEFGPDSKRPGRREPYRVNPGAYPTGVYTLKDICKQRPLHFHVSSLVFRRSMLPDFPEWFDRIQAADLAIIYLLAGNGALHYDARVASIRYISGRNFTQSAAYLSEAGLRRKLRDAELFTQHFPTARDNETFRGEVGRTHLKLARLKWNSRRPVDALRHYTRALRHIWPEMNAEMLARKVRRLFG